MTDHDIKTTLAELRDELEKTRQVDDDLRSLLEEVDADIHALLEADEQEQSVLDGLQRRLESLAADFAARHPGTERFFQELIGALGRMGI
jgi:archaellum component FlaC